MTSFLPDLPGEAHAIFVKLATSYLDDGAALLSSLATVAFVFTVSALIEIGVGGWPNSSLRRLLRPGPSARCDVVGAMLLQTPLLGHLGGAMSCGLTIGLMHLIRAHITPWWPAGALIGVRDILALVLVDAIGYALHRQMHASRVLWQLHRFHHAATEATLLTALRVHPLERAFNTLCVAWLFALLGMSSNEVGGVFIATQVLAMLHHSNLPSHWGKLGSYFLISPAAHRLHHSSSPAHFNRNFGILFPWWDRAFGTWYGVAAELPAIGLGGDRLTTSGWLASIWICYVDFLRAARKAALKPLSKRRLAARARP